MWPVSRKNSHVGGNLDEIQTPKGQGSTALPVGVTYKKEAREADRPEWLRGLTTKLLQYCCRYLEMNNSNIEIHGDTHKYMKYGDTDIQIYNDWFFRVFFFFYLLTCVSVIYNRQSYRHLNTLFPLSWMLAEQALLITVLASFDCQLLCSSRGVRKASFKNSKLIVINEASGPFSHVLE